MNGVNNLNASGSNHTQQPSLFLPSLLAFLPFFLVSGYNIAYLITLHASGYCVWNVKLEIESFIAVVLNFWIRPHSVFSSTITLSPLFAKWKECGQLCKNMQAELTTSLQFVDQVKRYDKLVRMRDLNNYIIDVAS